MIKLSASIKNTKIIVSKVAVKDNLNAAINNAVELIGGFEKIISSEEKILIKGNFNSPNRYPASSDPNFIRSVVKMLRANGVTDISLGASCGLAWQPTARVLKKKRVYKLADELEIKLINFDEGEWVKIDIDGHYLKSVSITKAAFDADKIIYLPNMKTHSHARFSMSLKFAVGLTGPFIRRKIHMDHLEEKVVEINLAVKPDLIILDARKCLVTGGPAKGKRKKAGLVLASTDLVALDVEALKILKSFNARNKLDMFVWELPQIDYARRLKLGVQKEDDYLLVSDDYNSV